MTPDIEHIRARAVHHEVTQADAYALLAAIDELTAQRDHARKCWEEMRAEKDAAHAVITERDETILDQLRHIEHLHKAAHDLDYLARWGE